MHRAGLCWALCVALVAPLPGARAIELGTGPALLFADRVSVDSTDNVITAEGNVEILHGGRRLLTDVLRYDQDQDQIEATGNVTLIEPSGEALYADRVTLSGDLRTGVAQQLRARLTDDSLFAAAQGRRIEGTRTELDRAVYSPCPLCPDDPGSAPLWQLTAQRIIHDQEAQQITYRNAFLEFYGVPVAYTPYLSHPDPTVERRSGLLAPSFGNDSELGLFLQTPYYFALAPNYDVTLAPIVTTKENPVLTAEYRHLLPAGRFELAGSGTYATEAGSDANPAPSGQAFRGHVEGEGRFQLTRRARWGYDLAATTDNTYLQRYNFSNANVLTNRLFAEQVWQRNFASISSYAFQGLRSFDHQDEIPFALPLAEAELTSEPWRWGSRFTFDSSLLALTRLDGLDTRRLSATGGWELPWTSQLGEQYRLALSLRGDAYQTNGDPQDFGSTGGTNVTGRVLPRMTVDWSWPWVGDSFGLTPLIEPVASFTWTVDDPNEDDIPNEDSQDLEFDESNLFAPSRFSGIDQVEGGARISYGLRFGGYGRSGELVSGLFGQSYRLSGDDADFGPDSGIDDDFSDYVGRIEVVPDPSFRVRYRFRLDQSDLTPTRSEIGALFGPRRLRFDVAYLSLEDDPELDRSRKREEITAGVIVGLSRSIALRAQTRRNLQQERNVWHKFGIIYRHPCLDLVAGIEQRNTGRADAKDSTTFSVRVTLANLGEFGVANQTLGPFSDQ